MIYSTIQMTVMIISAAIMAFISIYAHVHRRERGARYFAWFMMCRSVFACTVILEIISDSLSSKLFFRNTQQSALTFAVPFILFFVLDYIGKDKMLKPLRMLPVFFVFAAWTLLICTDSYHHLIRNEIALENGHLIIVRAVPAIVFNIFCFAVVTAALVFLGIHTRRSSPRFRNQGIWILIYIAVPVLVEMVKLANPRLAPLLIPISVYSGLLGAGTFWIIFKYRFFSIVPIARDKVVETMQEGVLIVDSNGAVTDNNAFVHQLFAKETISQAIILERNVSELLAPWPEWQAACSRMEQGKMEIETSQHDEKKVYTVNVYPLYSDRGRKLGTVSILFDITENRKRYEQMVELNRMKDQLFTIVSHDIRDPLAVLVNLTDLLEIEKPHLSEDSSEVIDAVTDQVRNTYTMVENLLEWFRSQKGGMSLHPQSWELSGIVREAVNMLRVKSDAKRVPIQFGIKDGIRVYADRETINLIVRNLLSNAIKFTEHGGLVRVDAEQLDEMIIVSIHDNGVGIEPDKVRQLFDHAHFGSTVGTAGEKGTGLGLLVCKEFVQMSGGDIWVDSVPGQGSVFYFSLPRTLS